MSSVSSRPTQSPPTTQSRTRTGAVATTCKVAVPPAPLPSSSFANDRERRGDDEEEEWGSVVIGHHGPAWMSDGRMGEGIGVSLTSRLLSRVGQNSGRGGKWNETTINCKRGGCIVVVVVKRGGRRGEVASSSSSEEMWGRRDSDDICGGRGCVFVVFFLVVEQCGQRPRGEGGRGATIDNDDDDDARRGSRVFVGVGATPIPAVKHPPLPDGEGEGEGERRAGGTQQST